MSRSIIFSRVVLSKTLNFSQFLRIPFTLCSVAGANKCTFSKIHSQIQPSSVVSSCGDSREYNSTNGKISLNWYRSIHVTVNPIYKKSKASKNLPVQDDIEDENEEDIEEDLLGKGDQIVRLRLPTDRLDAVLKAGLNLSRNKIEKAFYKDRVRVNGERPKKKSQLIVEGDEVDLVRRYNAKNPDYLDVSRLEIIQMGSYTRINEDDDDDEAKIPVKVKRYKNLTIENYRVAVKGNLNED